MLVSAKNFLCGADVSPGSRARCTCPAALLHLLALVLAGTALARDATDADAGRPALPPGLLSQPLYFEADYSAGDAGARFIARSRSGLFSISPGETSIQLCKATSLPTGSREDAAERIRSRRVLSRNLRLQFLGANLQAALRGTGELPGKVNYFIGSDPGQWRTSVPLFSSVRVTDLYPGIDLVYYGNEQQLEYDLVIAPGASPDAVSFRVSGANRLRLDSEGNLVLKLGAEELLQHRPIVYQVIAGSRKEVGGNYVLRDAQTVAYDVGPYDQDWPLIIDPVLSYSSYLGGSGSDIGWDIALDPNGFVYIAGETLSSQLPASPGAFQTNYAGGNPGAGGDAFVAKFGNGGSNLVYLTYLGGRGDDAALGIAVDRFGSAFVTGVTDSTNFPTRNAISNRISGTKDIFVGLYPFDAFVTRLAPDGASLVYSTYLGGNTNDQGIGIAVDTNGNAYVTGFTRSTNFPTANALKPRLGGKTDAFVTKIASNGLSFVYSTFLGGTNDDHGEGIAADAAGFAYVTGYTLSTNFPTAPTNAALQPRLNNSTNLTSVSDAFVAKLTPSGNALVYSTFLGGSGTDTAFRIAADADGNAYVTGSTLSTNFPRTRVTFPTGISSTNLSADVFVSKINSNGTALAYSTYFGGRAKDEGWAIAVDPARNAYITGLTLSTNFPSTNVSGALSATNHGGNDAFVAVLNSNATAFLYSAYLGGRGADFGLGIAVDPAGNAYLVGETSSTDFPAVGAFQSTFHGTNDAFIAKILVDPILRVLQAGNNLQVRWRGFAPEYTLQVATNLARTTTWTAVPQTPVLTNGWHTATFGRTNRAFFRLKR